MLMFVRFVPPRAFHIVPPDPTLEVVLVNAKAKGAPLHPDAVAQANLDGGGTKEKGRPSSPLPDSSRVADGDVLASSQRRIEELQKEQKQLAAKLKDELKTSVPQVRENPSANESGDAGVTTQTDSQQGVAGRAAAIDRTISEQAGRPKKVFISPRTREVGHAMYYKSMQRKIENIGTLNFPQRNGRKLYGELVVTIPVAQDGTLYEKEGGPRVERSSGNAALDNAALRIVRRAAPFGPFPPKMRSAIASEVWVIETRFRFTRDEALETES
ncbi:MAG: TonB family protein [Oxalobacter sp.]|nr:TonB family protein [Oxalobacter sp.]